MAIYASAAPACDPSATVSAGRHMLTTGELYKDPDADYFRLQAPVKTKDRAIVQLESLDYQVTLEPLRKTG